MAVHILLVYIAAVSLALFIAMGIDKGKSRRGAWRIPEKKLFLLALIGGAAGGTLGMFAFRHKTRHWYFRIGFPALALLQLGFALWLYFGPLSI